MRTGDRQLRDVQKILVITLSNIGDVILTLPVIDVLRHDMPQAQLTVAVGAKAASLFEGNPAIGAVEVITKRQSLRAWIAWLMKMRACHFDLVVDLRNTAIPLFLGARYRTSLCKTPHDSQHMRRKHLKRLAQVYPYAHLSPTRHAIALGDDVRRDALQLLSAVGGDLQKPYAVIAPGAAFHGKRWTEAGYATIADMLINAFGMQVVFVGSGDDAMIATRIAAQMRTSALSLCGKTTLRQLVAVVENSSVVLTNDSATLHIASYGDIPVVGIFGPTDPHIYGPWGSSGRSVRTNSSCHACRHPRQNQEHTCMAAVSVENVITEISHVLR